ncbi:kinesin-like protein [Plasmopara halstedii]|uniref:Kinesin-like protein n=1 Tax=Plasmopara halstedii TaxID=4781 RepID=A0A0P1AHA5_PLAHL|nr:kinesin-like protein [Plasmopara halstedii]CEG40352.1 kinesin-like protein [Plasmopara halstedii]|eukprot:XP_024576721.1 kinesin-like protein [Plasmopara halstedii]
MIANDRSPASLAPELASIKVFCRLRKQNQLEKREHALQCTTVVGGRTLFLRNERCEVDEIRCTFDRVFDVNSKQEEVYTHTAKPLVQEFLQGFNCTIFAYGQTGSGKTHTILGPKDSVLVGAEDEAGIISRVAKDLYEEVERAKTDPIQLSVSFVEIYMEQIRDLLNSSNGNVGTPTNGGLKIRESAQFGIYIEEMTRIHSKSEASMMELVKSGTLSRAVSSTRMNKDSSRSHTILMISCLRVKSGRRATMYIVDLAGSELVTKTNASGRVLQEAKAINKSLSALSNVIKALGEGKRHVPYRDSKLTRLLQDSLGGTAKTCLILAASCSSYNMSETISTLRFGLRAKEIKNPVVQRTDAGESGAAFTTGILFKELYQRAMEDMEAKNRTIDELQRLLAEKFQEKPQLHENELGPSKSLTAPTQDTGTFENADVSDADDVGEGDNEEDASDEDGNDSAQIFAQTIAKLELKNQALEEENRILFGVLERLESKLDEVRVDLSTGRPILSLSSQSENTLEGDLLAIDASWEAAAPSLRSWLESDNWRKTFESRLEVQCESVVHPVAQLSANMGQLEGSDVTHYTSTLKDDDAKANLLMVCENATLVQPSIIQEPIPTCSTINCVHHADAEALSRQLVELKLQLHYLSENSRLSLGSENHSILSENAQLKARIEELVFQNNVCNVTCSQLEMKNRACETRLSNQETHINCLQNSLQEYQGLFKQQIIMSQEKCRLLTDELEFYKKLAKCSQENCHHVGWGSSPGRRKSKSPSPKKNASNSSNCTRSLNDQTLSLISYDSAAASDSQLSSSSAWPGSNTQSNIGSSLSDITSHSLAAKAQRGVAKPIGQRVSSTREQTLRTETKWHTTSMESSILSLDDLTPPATIVAPAVTSPFSL